MITESFLHSLNKKSKEELIALITKMIEEEAKHHYNYDVLVNSGLHGAELSNLD